MKRNEVTYRNIYAKLGISHQALNRLTRVHKKIIETACNFTPFTLEDLRVKNRKQDIAISRQLVMYYLKQCGYSNFEAAFVFGLKLSSTHHAVHVIVPNLEYSKDPLWAYEILEEMKLMLMFGGYLDIKIKDSEETEDISKETIECVSSM